MISQELLDKFNIAPMEQYESANDFYLTFLAQTDKIISKAQEEYISGKSKTDIRAKYKEIIEAREYARSQISEESE